MVIDTSALIAILGYEPEAEQFAAAIQDDLTRLISAATLLECAIVIEARYGQAGGDKLDQLVRVAQISVEAVTVEQVAAARLAFRTYGKGRHPAALNFGDCFAYALAKVLGEPLLFIGDDDSRACYIKRLRYHCALSSFDFSRLGSLVFVVVAKRLVLWSTTSASEGPYNARYSTATRRLRRLKAKLEYKHPLAYNQRY